MSIYINRPASCNRYEAQRSLDFAPGTDVSAVIDRAMISTAENIEGQLHRVFYPSDDTRYVDWPPQGVGSGYADPWRLHLRWDLTCLTALTAGGVTIPLNQVFARPWENPRLGRPYFTFIELDRSTPAAFGGNAQTPQYSIAMTATWGYGADADPAGTLAAAVGDTDTAITVSDSSLAAPGDLIVLGYGRGTTPFPGTDPHAGAIAPYLGERVLITDASPALTGLTQSGAGCSTPETTDTVLQWTGTGSLNAGEVITLDSEDMLVERVTATTATVRRAFNGTTLDSHSSAPVYAMRLLSVWRAQLGTTAGAYASGAAVCRHRVPQLVRDLAIAEVGNRLLQEGSGYARVVGSGESAHPAPGVALADLWDECRTRHGRKARSGGV